MEVLFLGVLVVLMVLALLSGFPVAFALPGCAILSIGIAAFFGWLIADNPDAYFSHGGPVEWINAGITNFRSLYWDVERDTLIAIPLFIFMGIMLQRSKVAEDLLIAMARLFGPVPGGLGISVIVVGALLAATTGIVGATVVAMGLISLPAMMRNNYSPSLACGTICASGTLGQIIPPSIVLIILSDQLAAAAAQAGAIRKTEYRESTGEFSMPSILDVSSVSAGDMFMGALLPGMLLVLLYIAYIFFYARFKPQVAPPVASGGQIDRAFIKQLLLALVPPLALIFTVLGSIILGVATVNQAGAIGAVGALIMGGYRLFEGERYRYVPVLIVLAALMVLAFLSQSADLNFKSSGEDRGLALFVALTAVVALLAAIGWSAWRVWKANNALHETMIETAKTTSMVFVILIGAAMLTSAFRGFGGEELVKDFLNSLPGGFWGQFFVVMLVIFLLGFFLDFIEIAVVVVPIVAPILLANPEANVTAVWLGVMVGLNIQTSFLTPPFGFALFYLRGVAEKAIKTLQIYRGVVPFIGLQLLALLVVGFSPKLVNYLPTRSYLMAETAPPPINPRVQPCLEEWVFAEYATNESQLRQAISQLRNASLSTLPEIYEKKILAALSGAESVFDKVADVRQAESARLAAEHEYRPYHQQVRRIKEESREYAGLVKAAQQELTYQQREEVVDEALVASLRQQIAEYKAAIANLEASVPNEWAALDKSYKQLGAVEKRARLTYRRSADAAYTDMQKIGESLEGSDALVELSGRIDTLNKRLAESGVNSADLVASIKELEQLASEQANAQAIKSLLYKARRALRKDDGLSVAAEFLAQASTKASVEAATRLKVQRHIAEPVSTYLSAIESTIGARQQARLSQAQVNYLSSCMSEHRNVSLYF